MKYILFAFLIVLCNYGRAQTTSAQSIWYNLLPDCPCKNPDIDTIVLNDGWAKDKGGLSKYHKGAATSYRSYPPVKTMYGKSGQQCCYDRLGKLITSGQAAGTPDKKSTCRGENKKGVMKLRAFGIIGHIKKDVQPWNKLMKMNTEGWKKYNAEWVPNSGNGCRNLTGSK